MSEETTSPEEKFCPECGAELTCDPDTGEKTCAACAEKEAQLTNNCPNCGGTLTFDPSSGQMRCSGCKQLFEAHDGSTDDVCEYDLLHSLGLGDDLNEENEQFELTCENCGGKTELPQNVLSGFCQYCKAPLVASQHSLRTIRPHGILPFKLGRPEATNKFKDWLKTRWFLPNKMRQVNLNETMQGMYHPLWTFDFTVRSHYRGRRGTHYYVTRTRTRDGKTETYLERRTRWTPVSGSVTCSFDDLLVRATQSGSFLCEQELRPWELASAVNYEKELVRGFVEASYDRGLADSFKQAQSDADIEVRAAIRSDIGGDEQDITSMHNSYSDESYKLLLVPCWQSCYSFSGKQYGFWVNGQTGKVYGERPWSVWKLTALTAACLAVIGMLYWLFETEAGRAFWEKL